jgi:tetratricopeptide (TPR) repeat protein
MNGFIGSLLLAVLVGLVRTLFEQRRASPAAPATPAAPVDLRSPEEKRADDIQSLLESGDLDAAVGKGREWIREIDAGQAICESVAAGALASILEALVGRLPKDLDVTMSFGETLLSLLNAKPSCGKSAKLRTFHAMGIVADAAGNSEASRERSEAAVELAASMDGVGPDDRAYFLLRSAASCRANGDLDEAARRLERALVLQGEASENGRQRLEILMLAGIVQFEKGQIREARATLERAQETASAAPELQDRFWIGAGMIWGQVLLAQSDTAAVAALARTAEVEERVLGPESVAPISTLYHLSSAHFAQGSLPDAVAALERARALHDRVVGRHSRDLREILISLSRVKFAQGEREEARRILTGLVEAEQRVSNPNDAVIANLLVNLSAICRSLDDTRAERGHLQRALMVAERANGPDSPALMPILERLGYAVWNSADWAESRDINRRLAALQRGHLGSDHPALASTLFNQAIVTARSGDHADAQGLITETMSILEATPFRPPDAVDRIVARLEELQHHPVHGGGYKNLLPRARALRVDGAGGLPVAQA